MSLITGTLSTELGDLTDLSPSGVRKYLKSQDELLADAFAEGSSSITYSVLVPWSWTVF